MHWYYDNEGLAEGPLDDEAMATLLNDGKLAPRTLIWQPEMERWSEVSQVAPAWSLPKKKRSITASVLSKLTGGIPVAKPASDSPAETGGRKPMPMAPSGPEKGAADQGLLKRLFKFGRK